MSEKFQNKYRIPSARASWWNYNSNAAYFITICAKNRIHYFGKVVSCEMILSPFGKFAQQCWNEIPQHFPFVILDEFVVMPNHIHGIIIIYKMDDAQNLNSALSNDISSVQTQYFASPDDIASADDIKLAIMRHKILHLLIAWDQKRHKILCLYGAVQKTHLAHNRKIWHQLFVDLKLA